MKSWFLVDTQKPDRWKNEHWILQNLADPRIRHKQRQEASQKVYKIWMASFAID